MQIKLGEKWFAFARSGFDTAACLLRSKLQYTGIQIPGRPPSRLNTVSRGYYQANFNNCFNTWKCFLNF
jgi:hypothetical protein